MTKPRISVPLRYLKGTLILGLTLGGENVILFECATCLYFIYKS
jgi:hypothetical protein